TSIAGTPLCRDEQQETIEGTPASAPNHARNLKTSPRHSKWSWNVLVAACSQLFLNGTNERRLAHNIISAANCCCRVGPSVTRERIVPKLTCLVSTLPVRPGAEVGFLALLFCPMR